MITSLPGGIAIHTAFATPVRATAPDIEGDEGFLVLVRSPIKPEEADDHVARVTYSIESYISSLPGYISGNLHVRLDKREFLNYTEWKTEKHYDDFIVSLEEERGQVVVENVRYVPDMIRYRYHETLFPESITGKPSSTGFAAVIRAEVEPGQAEDAYQSIRQYILGSICCPGFISASLHIKLDDTEMMSYMEWKSEADYDAFVKTAELHDRPALKAEKFTRVRALRASQKNN